MDNKSQKQTMREQARLHRDRMDVNESDFERIIDVFFETLTPTKDKIIALYWPMGKELDCRFLMDELVKQNYQCALPCVQKNTRVMMFRPWHHDVEMREGAFGVLEPQSDITITPDIVLAPLLAFDQKGYRLGQGGGHYDATLEDLRAQKAVQYIGLGYKEQAVLLKLPREDHDVPLDAVLTPQGLVEF